MLKKLALFVLIAFAVLLVSAFISAELAATITILYFLALIVALIYFAIKGTRKLCGKAQKSDAETPAKEVAPQAQKPVVVQVTPPHVYAQQAQKVQARGISRRYENVGVFVPYADVLERPDLCVGAIVTFRQEPENRFDKHAVAVVIGRKRIGYLFRGEIQDKVNASIESGVSVSGRIVKFNPDAPNLKGSSIAIDLFFYE